MLPKRAAILPVLACALATALTGLAAPAQASASHARHASSDPRPLYFSARLSGANELAAPGGPAVGDPNASATGEVEIEGTQVTFAFSWKGMPAPSMGHIHSGAAGVNGPIKVPLFMSALPETTTAAAGVVTVDDASLVAAITSHPADFYLNLHTTEFPAGAVRGQLTPVRHGRSTLDLLPGLPLQALMDGGQEIPVAGGPAVGDPDGQGIGMVRASGRRIRYTFAWSGVGQPIMGHIHLGRAGVSGPVVVPLFMSPVPEHIFAISGLVPGVEKNLVARIRHKPSRYYVNLHTTEFPGGAIRGQLYR